ncbi:MAG: glycoside hydrolase family 3 C-terminal domain-containing protein [Ignavibacteria bacterium]|nr:glycoside hydrolase family 3 C-terminal domain-containing protein [Ignavibacteria bacterium]
MKAFFALLINSISNQKKKLVIILVIIPMQVPHPQTLDERANTIIGQMTLEEKIQQLHHEGGFNTADNTRLGVPGFFMADGPHGVRDGMATCFPVGISMAATWDPELIFNVGISMGKEFKGKGRHQALGPCMDLCRDPRNGRSPETGGEDPYLNAKITTALIQGIQNTGVIATAKHFNLVNKQNIRHNSNIIIDQRTLIEHYGLNFRSAVQEGGVMSVMNAYNLINGEKCAENFNLLTQILGTQWGFPYYVVSDWGSIWDTEAAITAGCNICMGSDHYQNELLNLVQLGFVSEAIIDDAVLRVLRTKIMAGMLDYYLPGNPDDINSTEHQQLALEVARKSIILLKNDNNLLPLNKNNITVALIGPSANIAQLDGTGSSYVTPFYTVTPREAIESKIGSANLYYTKGCDINSSDTTGFTTARNLALNADVVIYVGGLDVSQEGEGLDRVTGSIDLPGKQQILINELAQVNSNIVVVLESGGVCGINNCISNINALIYAFYPGQEGGNAIADVLFGDYNPGGKLPVSLPRTDSQLPEWNEDFTDDHGCGYRWYDAEGLIPQYSFGHGLSYTTFTYSNLFVSPTSAYAGEFINISVDVQNTGSLTGDEVVQLYLTDVNSSLVMPVKQLKGFKRVTLQPGETQTVEFVLTPEEFYYYDDGWSSFQIEPGAFIVKVGGSSDNLPLSAEFTLLDGTPKSDLLITNLKYFPPYPSVGDEIVFLATVKNQGTSPSPSGTLHKVIFKVNGEEVSLAIEFNESIPVGGMALISADTGLGGKNSWTAGPIGAYDIQAVIDPANIIGEWHEDNNSKSTSLRVIPSPPINIALNKLVVVSSIEGTGLEGENAVDGQRSTRWASQFSDPQFIYVDLESVTHIEQIDLIWETAFAEEYEIQISDNAIDWFSIDHITDGDGGMDRIFTSSEGRYVRMYGIQRGTEWGYSIFEFEIYSTRITQVDDDDNENNDYGIKGYNLENNFPNPFNPGTTLRYKIADPGYVKLDIYNISGERITRLINGQHQPGNYEIYWDGKDNNNQEVSSGVYIYRLQAGQYLISKKMILLK